MSDEKFIENSKLNNSVMLNKLLKTFKELSINYLGTSCNFLTFEVKRSSDALFKYLLKNGIMVRPLRNYKLSKYLRVSLGTPSDMHRFIKSLRSYYNEKI